MAPELVFVTANAHKLSEVQRLAGTDLKLRSLADLNCCDDIPETGLSFQENASQKSKYIYSRYQTDCFADDSGLEVDALDGEPGIYSARYSGSRDTQTNLQLVLDKLNGIPNRKARFRCVISLILGGREYFFDGAVEGSILQQPRGPEGFGYDPIFLPDGYSQSFAEMPVQLKNQISHRGKAVSEMVKFIMDKSI